MTKITLELESYEALMVLDPIQLAALEDQRIAARSKGEKADHAAIRAQVRQRIATLIVDSVFPDTCRWMDNEDCPNPIERDGLCGRHLRHRAAVAGIMARPA